MGDAEYISVMQNIILPVAYEFCPELILVSAGFDAAVGDPLGGDYFLYCLYIQLNITKRFDGTKFLLRINCKIKM